MSGTLSSVVGGAIGASARGASHIARDKPNQDAVGWAQSRLWTYIAVADGHGSAPHYRSDRGSRFAVDTLLALLRDATRDGALREPDALARTIPDIARLLVERWRRRVEDDVATDPVGEAAGFDRLTVYGSTCLGAAVGPGMSFMVQIGDGDLFAGVASGDIARPFTADALEGEQTYSLCLPDAEHHVKVALFTAPNPLCAPDFVLASTDGFEKSFGDAATVLDIVRHYWRAVRERGLEEVAGELAPWLAKCSAMGSGDDTTVAIFAADPGSQGAVAGRTRPAPAAASPGKPVAAPALAPREPVASTAGLLAAVALCGLVGGISIDRWGVPLIARLWAADRPAQLPPGERPIQVPTAPAPSGDPAPIPVSPSDAPAKPP